MTDTERLLEKLRAERDGIDNAIRLIEQHAAPSHAASAGGKKKRHLSAETRRLLSNAAKKRWSKQQKA
jgi:hypothetical protein